MKAPALLRRLVQAAGLGLAAAAPAPAEALHPGGVLLCASAKGRPPVLGWMGRTERWADHGVAGERGDVLLVHLQLALEGGGDMDRSAHAPFEIEALRDCEPIDAARATPDPSAFEEGYAMWRAAGPQGAGAFTIDPAEAYWAIMDIRDGATGP